MRQPSNTRAGGVAIGAIAGALTTFGVVHCSPQKPPQSKADIIETHAFPPATTFASTHRDGGAPTARPAPPKADAIADENLPPPRPTTLPLKFGDAADVEIEEADKQFELGAFAEVTRALAKARTAAPKSPALVVAKIRLDVAKLALPTNVGVGKDHPGVIRGVTALRDVVAKNPTYAAAHAELGRLFITLGDAKSAKEELRAAASSMGTQAEVHGNLGLAMLVLGERDAAIAELIRAVELDPGSAPRRGNLGTAMLLEGRMDEAIRHYGVRVRIAPTDADAHSDLGTALLGTSELPRAVAELEKAVELDPKRATFRSNLGYALSRSKRSADALAQYRKAVALDPKLVSGWVNLGIELSRDEKTRSEGRQCLEKARALDPRDTRTKEVIDELNALPAAPAPSSTQSKQRAPRTHESSENSGMK